MKERERGRSQRRRRRLLVDAGLKLYWPVFFPGGGVGLDRMV